MAIVFGDSVGIVLVWGYADITDIVHDYKINNLDKLILGYRGKFNLEKSPKLLGFTEEACMI